MDRELDRLRQAWPSARQASAVILLSCCAAAPGCGRTKADYIPSPDAARQAVVAAMDAWQRGEPPGHIAGKPAIQVGDAQRRPGQTLVAYTVLGELPSTDGRTFAVRVQLDHPAAEVKVHYLVIGIDPLWVFREEDYKMATHWEHNMGPAPSATAQAASP